MPEQALLARIILLDSTAVVVVGLIIICVPRLTVVVSMLYFAVYVLFFRISFSCIKLMSNFLESRFCCINVSFSRTLSSSTRSYK